MSSTSPPVSTEAPRQPAPGRPHKPRGRQRASSEVRSLLSHGEPFLWLTGGALVFCVAMILGLLLLVALLGLSTFRPAPLLQVPLRDGGVLLGELTGTEDFELTAGKILSESESIQALIVGQLAEEVGGDLSALPKHVQQIHEQLEQQIQDVQSRTEQAQQRAEQLAERAADKTLSPVERRRKIALSRGDESLVQTQGELAALRSRLATLQGERQAVDLALAYFAPTQHREPSALLAAELPVKSVGLAALLDLVADHRAEAAVRVRRRKLRTGNFELTGEHYRWVSDYEVADQGESYPDLALTVERVTWGRFYGTPQSFSLRFALQHPRERFDDPQQILQTQQLLDQLQQHQRMLTLLRDHRPGTEISEPELLEQQLQTLEDEYRELHDRAVQEFLASLPPADNANGSVRIETASGEVKSTKEITPQDEVTGAFLVWDGPEAAWQQFVRHHGQVRARFHDQERLKKHDLGRLSDEQERARLEVRRAELDSGIAVLDDLRQLQAARFQLRLQRDARTDVDKLVDQVEHRFGAAAPATQLAKVARQTIHSQIQDRLRGPQQTLQQIENRLTEVPEAVRRAVDAYLEIEASVAARSAEIQQAIEDKERENARFRLQMVTSDGQGQTLALADVVRAYPANRITTMQKAGVYLSRWREFLLDKPREANNEGGVLPAIWGTVTMTLIMSLAVVPFGVLASLYLREYAKSGVIVSAIRIAINNLAGVPSIVFGVFGLGFFCYIIGAYLDGGPRNAGFHTLPPARWYLLAGVLAVVSLVAFLVGLLSLTGRHSGRTLWKQWLGYGGVCLWLISLSLLFYLLIKTPFFGGFYQANLPSPYWGTGGVLWAALTLALMTLPVVIVATEEALSAVPNSMREGSYGCGASKWQTIRRIVLPQALPGIMTGMILAMARGAGEVAPLMLVGAAKMAPELPIDTVFPFLHGNRSFMHLGFHIFDVGFQSQNSEAGKPMVYTTTLLLIVIITLLNLMAIQLRAYLRKRFVSGQF